MTPVNVRIRGETIANLAAAMHGLKIGKPDADGMVPVRGNIGNPAIRALMQIEAELLLDDADALDQAPLQRTPGQRRSDAFAQLAREIAAALDA